MVFDFRGRVQAAFGFVGAAASRAIYTKLFGEATEDGSLNVGIYVADREATFDEIGLQYGGEEYHFAYRPLSSDYSNIFATPPMLGLKRAKKLILTPIDNSDIEVVERYGTEPWEIAWRGLLIDMENHRFPIDKMEALNRVFEANHEWAVFSDILYKVGVDTLYIRDISFDFVEGYEDTIAYAMTCRSIRSQEVQLISTS